MFSGDWKVLPAALVVALAGCGGHPVNEQTGGRTGGQPVTATADYNGSAYAGQVEQAILDGFLLTSFSQACPQPAWVCAIGRIESPREGVIDVTLRTDWESIFGEWKGPPAGVGCLKWGAEIRRNIKNFTTVAGVQTPTNIAVREPSGRNC